ncbi:2011_t:CDS:1, partial [Racocetra fulgida]
GNILHSYNLPLQAVFIKTCLTSLKKFVDGQQFKLAADIYDFE